MLLWGALGWALYEAFSAERKPRKPKRETGDMDRRAIEQLIRERAREHGVPEAVALAFADAESGLDPNAEGDTRWPTSDGGVRYRRFVLGNPDYADNPDRDNAEAWHSYGLFQLHAAHHTPKGLRPRALLDPELNTRIALAKIARLIRHYGTPTQARIAYVCGSPDGCSAERRAEITERFHGALARWEGLPVS
jgi:hypothetical protein